MFKIEKQVTGPHSGHCVSWMCLEKTTLDVTEVASFVNQSVAQDSLWMEGVWVIFPWVKVPLGKGVEGWASFLPHPFYSCLYPVWGGFLSVQSNVKIMLGLASHRSKILVLKDLSQLEAIDLRLAF